MHRTHLLIAGLAGFLLLFVGSSELFGADQPDSAHTSSYYPQGFLEEQSADSLVNPEEKPGKPKRIQHGVPVSKSPTGALFRSILIPGWGQLYTGHPIKAVVFFGTDVGMIYGALYQNRRYNDFLEQSRNTKSDVTRARLEQLADFYRDDRNKLIWWTGAVVLLSGFDAYVEAHLYDFHIDPTLGTTPSGDGFTTGLRITFH